MSDFDYGVDESEVSSGQASFKNPEVGDHNALLRSLIHVGTFQEEFQGQTKAPAPQVVAIFELKGSDDFEDDGETPLEIAKTFPLKKGDKSFMTKFIKALDPDGSASGFDELVGRMCVVNCKGSKDKGDDGKPKYINFGGISGAPTDKDILELLETKGRTKLITEGVGHCRFADLTKEAILELNPILHVADILMQSSDYPGSKAEQIVNEIRKDNPDFAKRKKKDDSKSDDSDKADNTPPPPSDLEEDAEF